MRLDAPLDDLLRAHSHVQVLRALHRLLPGITVSGRDVARRTGISHPTATAALRSLAGDGLVRVRRARRVDLFELNRDHVFAAELGRLFDREAGLRDDLVTFLRDQLVVRRVPVSEAYLFGSAARGEMGGASDVDVALICSADTATVVEEAAFGPIADAVAARFGSRLSPIVASRSLAALAGAGSPLWNRAAAEGIPILTRSAEQTG
jgi:DNA-binding transcriptional ArsR family regulator